MYLSDNLKLTRTINLKKELMLEKSYGEQKNRSHPKKTLTMGILSMRKVLSSLVMLK